MNTKDRKIRAIPDELWQRVRLQAVLADLTVRQFVIRALERAIQESAK